jgi:hypothetical protein
MKKKNYVYFLAPLAGLIIFSAIYWNFSSKYDKELEIKAAVKKEERAEKLRKENKLKEQAYNEAVAASEKRKKERAEKQKKDEADADARQMQVEERNKMLREETRLAEKLKTVTKEVEATKKEIAEIEETKKKAVDEEAFQRKYVKAAEDNRQGLTNVLEAIQKADDAIIAAAKAAAADAAAKAAAKK